jgi:hypothetical protein
MENLKFGHYVQFNVFYLKNKRALALKGAKGNFFLRLLRLLRLLR